MDDSLLAILARRNVTCKSSARAMERTRNLRVESVRPLLSPAILLEEVPVGESAAHVLLEGRRQASRILHGEDDRLLVVVGPCSVHRQLVSGLSMPIGFKTGTHGTVQLAIDAVVSAAHPHRFLGVTEQGLAAIVQTTGNPDCHVILRGGTLGPNFDQAGVTKAAE